MLKVRTVRRLASILVADVVGYSRLVEQDEAGTLSALRSLRRDLIAPLLVKHRGRIVKLMGDGAIIEFNSVVDAVTCAIAIQKGTNERQPEMPAERRIVFRVGINLGDVVVEGRDLLGDGVNIAARLERLCPPGGVLVSHTVYDHLQGKVDCHFESLGEQHLKNIARPIQVYQIASMAPAAVAPSSSDRPAVAVLPFDNMGDPDQVYFSDGITEDIITELSRFREFLVIARNSSFAFRNQDVDLRRIGQSLGASYLVKGSIRRAGQQIRVTVQLVEATTGTHLWAERYDRSLEDIFAIQDDIARHVVTTVAQRVVDESEIAAQRRPPSDIRAYDLFLQGYRLSDTFRPDEQDQARALFERAIIIDPGFARAYTGLAFNFLFRASSQGIGVPQGADPNRTEALRMAEQAVILDPNDARVHFTLGHMYLVWDDFDRAKRHLDLARSMNPNDAMIQVTWAWAQTCLGEAERGLPAAELAMRLNPRYPLFYEYSLARILFAVERYAEAAVILRRLTGEDPVEHPHNLVWHPRDLAWRAAACGHLGMDGEARQCGEWLITALRRAWHGDPNAGPAEYVDWIVGNAHLRLPADVTRLRRGLRLAGLPA
jgi:TolB-like protein/Tfp pilus assembly protein PilF